jgi:hypothetical protein
LQSGDGNSGLGHAVMAFNRTGDYSAALGYNAGMGAGNAQPSFDNSYMLYIGTNATSIPDTGITNGAAIGANSFIGQSNSISLGDTTVTTKVGIGTAYPTALLDVTGTLRFRNGATNGYVLTSDASGNATWQAAGGGATPTFQQVLTAGSTLTSNNTVDIDGNNFVIADGGTNRIIMTPSITEIFSETEQSSLGLTDTGAEMTGKDSLVLIETEGDVRIRQLTNLSTQNRIIGQLNTTGQLGYITVGTGLDLTAGVLTASGGGGTPAGNFGNLQINRNGAFATPASDSLTFLSTGFTSVAGAFSLTGGGARVYGNDAFGGAILRYGAGDAHAVTVQVGTISLSTNFNTRLQLVDASTTVSNRFRQTQGADVASAAGAIALGSDGNSFEITGTAAITLISNVGWQNGSKVTLLFTSTATLTDGTANSGTDIGMELAGNTNFTGSAGATITLLLSEIGGVQRYREVARSVN